MELQDAKIRFQIKINQEGSYKDQTIELDVFLDDLEEENLSEILIEKNYLQGWSNNDEYAVIGRSIMIV